MQVAQAHINSVGLKEGKEERRKKKKGEEIRGRERPLTLHPTTFVLDCPAHSTPTPTSLSKMLSLSLR